MRLNNGRLVLMDFGIARTERKLKGMTTALAPRGGLGTSGYAAPEQYNVDGVIDARTDLYGLGVVMHQLLTSVDPGSGQPFEFDPVRKHYDECPEWLEKIVNRATKKDPTERPPSARVFRKHLRNQGKKPKEDSKESDEVKGSISCAGGCCLFIVMIFLSPVIVGIGATLIENSPTLRYGWDWLCFQHSRDPIVFWLVVLLVILMIRKMRRRRK